MVHVSILEIQNCQKLEMAAKVTVLLFMAFTLALTMFTVHHQACAEDCYAEKVHVIDECFDFLRRYDSALLTSLDCSAGVIESDMACICRILDAHDEERISPEKMVRLARLEGKNLEAGKKCGRKCVIRF
jgi:hypothetical protein